MRLSAAGYRSTTLSASDAFDDVLLVPAPAPASLTVLDLDGRPIAGARFTTRQTCAHAPAAVDVRSDASGRCDLSLLPPLADEPEGQIDAPGFEALRSIEPETLLECGNWSPESYLGRKRPLRVRVLERDGTPAANLRIVLGAEPRWKARDTDEQGRVVFDSLFSDTPALLRASRGGALVHLLEICPWRDAEVVVRIGGNAADRATEDADAEVVVSGGEPGAPWLLVHEQGWIVDRTGPSRLPAGRCTLFTGADFSGWREDKQEFVLAPREKRELALAFEPEPRVKVIADWSRGGDVVIEAGRHSRRWPLPGDDLGAFPVPAGVPLAIVVSVDWNAWRLDLPPHETDEVADCLLTPRWRGPEPWHVAVLPAHIEPPREIGAAFSGEMLRARGPTQRFSALDAPSWHPVRGSNEPAELWLRADGHVSRAFAVAWSEAWEIDARLRAFAKLELRGDVARVVGPHGPVDLDESGAATLDEIAPGPLTVRVERRDGRWLALDLVLAPGEARVLDVR